MFLVLVAVLGIVTAVFYYLRHRNKFFERNGVPGPKPVFLFGNLLDVWGRDKIPPLIYRDWTRKYGSVYGFMEGGRPMLVTSDPDFLQEVMVKKFDHFHGRMEFSLQAEPESNSERINMFTARGPRWKRLRVISNPTFTAAKIKQMMPKVHACIRELLYVLNEKSASGKPFDIFKVYQAMTIDVIGRVAFALETTVQRDGDSDLLQLGNAIFRQERGLLVFLPSILPFMRKLVFQFAILTARVRKAPFVAIREHLSKFVEEKRKSKTNSDSVDFIDLLLNAEADTKDILTNSLSSTRNGTDGRVISGQTVIKKLTAGEIASQSLLFLLAGYETTSTALTYVTYFLAKYPEVQEKLQSEIDEYFQQEQEITHAGLQKLTYLECVIQETLRLFPLASPVVARRCMSPCTINGVHIDEGVTVLADVWSMHYNEQLWGADVKEFKPERFLPDYVPKSPPHPFAYLPFGSGPRICIGMRFAQLEMKAVLCSILSKYRIKRCPETQDPIEFYYTGVTVAPKNGLDIVLAKRTDILEPEY